MAVVIYYVILWFPIVVGALVGLRADWALSWFGAALAVVFGAGWGMNGGDPSHVHMFGTWRDWMLDAAIWSFGAFYTALALGFLTRAILRAAGARR